MLSESSKPWHILTPTRRTERLTEILAELDRQKQNEPVHETCGEWWKSAGFMQQAAIFIADITMTSPSQT